MDMVGGLSVFLLPVLEFLKPAPKLHIIDLVHDTLLKKSNMIIGDNEGAKYIEGMLLFDYQCRNLPEEVKFRSLSEVII